MRGHAGPSHCDTAGAVSDGVSRRHHRQAFSTPSTWFVLCRYHGDMVRRSQICTGRCVGLTLEQGRTEGPAIVFMTASSLPSDLCILPGHGDPTSGVACFGHCPDPVSGMIWSTLSGSLRSRQARRRVLGAQNDSQHLREAAECVAMLGHPTTTLLEQCLMG